MGQDKHRSATEDNRRENEDKSTSTVRISDRIDVNALTGRIDRRKMDSEDFCNAFQRQCKTFLFHRQSNVNKDTNREFEFDRWLANGKDFQRFDRDDEDRVETMFVKKFPKRNEI